MTIRNFDKLLAPRSVALIGASPRPGSVGAVLTRNLVAGRVPVELVNPRHAEIGGRRCFPDVASLPEPPDLAVIATPAMTVPGLVAELGAKGTRAAVVISAGFGARDEGRRLTQAMLDAARPHLLRILGPNCLGLMLPGLGLNASFANLTPAAGSLAFLSQSGAILTSVIDWAGPRQIGFSYLVSLGEMADVDVGDMLDFLAADKDTRAILLYVEAITAARKFMSAARIAARSKPVIVMKAGRFAVSAAAVASHTGALAGADAVYDAAFRRAGMLRVFGLEELFDAVESLATLGSVGGDRLAILTNGGGLGILASDALADEGGRLAELAPATIAALDRLMPRTWSRANPVDIVGDADPDRYASALSALLADPNADALLVLHCPTATAPCEAAADATLKTIGRPALPVLTCWVGAAEAARARARLAAAGLASYETPEQAVRGFMQLVRYRANQAQLLETPPSLPADFAPDRARVGELIATALAAGRTLLIGPEARAVVAAYGIPVVESRVARDAKEAAQTAAAIGGPVALKILSPDIAHKSDLGGVVLELEGAIQVESAAATMLARIREQRPDARIEGFTLERMVNPRHARELIIGLAEDPTFGPVVLFGAGGVAVEITADRAIGLPPLNLALARALMRETRIYRLLEAHRDRPAADLDAVAMALVKLSQLAVDHAEIAELDVNPLLADPTGVIALDVRIKLRPAPRGPIARLAIRPYPSELETPFLLPDGRAALLRPIRPEDAPSISAAFARLSPESIRMRFFTTMKRMPPDLAARLSQLDYDREMALAVTGPEPPGQAELFAVVRLSADPDNERAEFAIVVRDDLMRRGIGRRLMDRIIAYARERGLIAIFGVILAENRAMIELCRRLGFRIEAEPAQADLVRATLDLGARAE